MWQVVDSHCVVPTEVSSEWSIQTSSHIVFLQKYFLLRAKISSSLSGSISYVHIHSPQTMNPDIFVALVCLSNYRPYSCERSSSNFDYCVRFSGGGGGGGLWFLSLYPGNFEILGRLCYDIVLANPVSLMNRPLIWHCTDSVVRYHTKSSGQRNGGMFSDLFWTWELHFSI